tara:strand:+ start:126 stop:827 length:702 start_codon:yes stop_codon:yes gene_type:complete
MWSYYGSKGKVVDCYPPPKFNKIIEPFAGSARYSLKYWENDVLLVDKYDVIVKIWQWLQKCSKEDILTLPNMAKGQSTDDFNFDCIEAKWLIGFCINSGSASPKKSVQQFNSWNDIKPKIADNLHKIKHWTIQLGTYDEIPNFPNATWFIDPPYQFGGEYYRFSNKSIDFNHLANWCKNSTGQAIVCENTKADWLDFKPMLAMQGAMYKTVEAIWSNLPTNYDNVQQTLFDYE